MNESTVIGRRGFLKKSLPAGAGLCFGCGLALTEGSAQELPKNDGTLQVDPCRTKNSADTGMSYEQVFNLAFRDHSIPYLLTLSETIGREKLVEMLKSATDNITVREDFRRQFHRNLPAGFFDQVVVQELLEKTEKVRVQKVTRCLWAETYRAANAADIGYAMWCYVDYTSARLRGEKLERNQTLMQGHDCCLLKWTKEA